MLLNFPLDLVQRLAKHPGVCIEHCYVPEHPKKFDVGRIAEVTGAVGLERNLIADFGAFGKDKNIVDALVAYGLPLETVHTLAVTNPTKFLAYD